MLKIGDVVVIPLLALVVTGAIGCGQRGQGTNIAEGKTCLAGDPKSTCAAGMYCQPTGMETQHGEIFWPGVCRQQKTAGQSCSSHNLNECAVPLKCVADSTSAGGSTDPVASWSGPKHCR